MTKQEFMEKWFNRTLAGSTNYHAFNKDLDALLSSQQGGKVISEEIIDVVGGKSEFKKLANIEPSAVCDNSRLATDKANAMFQEETSKAQDSVIEPKVSEPNIQFEYFQKLFFEYFGKLTEQEFINEMKDIDYKFKESDQPKVSEPVKGAEEWIEQEYGKEWLGDYFEWDSSDVVRALNDYLEYANQFKNSK